MSSHNLQQLLLSNLKGEYGILQNKNKIDKSELREIIPKRIYEELSNEVLTKDLEEVKVINFGGEKGIGKSTILSAFLVLKEVPFVWINFNQKNKGIDILNEDDNPRILVIDDIHYALLKRLDELSKEDKNIKELSQIDVYKFLAEKSKYVDKIDKIYETIIEFGKRLTEGLDKILSEIDTIRVIVLVNDFKHPHLFSLMLVNSYYHPKSFIQISRSDIIKTLYIKNVHEGWTYVMLWPRILSYLYNALSKEKFEKLLSKDPSNVLAVPLDELDKIKNEITKIVRDYYKKINNIYSWKDIDSIYLKDYLINFLQIFLNNNQFRERCLKRSKIRIRYALSDSFWNEPTIETYTNSSNCEIRIKVGENIFELTQCSGCFEENERYMEELIIDAIRSFYKKIRANILKAERELTLATYYDILRALEKDESIKNSFTYEVLAYNDAKISIQLAHGIVKSILNPVDKEFYREVYRIIEKIRNDEVYMKPTEDNPLIKLIL